jgi:hypothetical protein
LLQFAIMGSVYWRQVHKVAQPRVGILSNGEEPSKGNELTRSAAAALLQMAEHVNYVGYVEGRDINRAKADVVVTDGFTGNVTLKTMEGFASFLLGNLREVFDSSLLRRLFYFFFFRRSISTIRQRLDPSEYGGAPLLGVNGTAIIAHGSSSARAIRNAMRAAANEALVRHVNSEIVDALSKVPTSLIVKPASARGIRGVLERMRERLHPGRDAHAKRPEAFPDSTQREGPQGKREVLSASSATVKTGPFYPDLSSVEANNRNQTSLTNGLPPADEADRGDSELTDKAGETTKPA